MFFVVGHILRDPGEQFPVEENALHPSPPILFIILHLHDQIQEVFGTADAKL